MKGLFQSFILLLVSVFFFQCQKELSHVGSPDPEIHLPQPITANLHGNVLDENGLPAVGVEIKVGNKTGTTDTKGYFRINGASLDKKAALVTAEKTGYFKALRSFSATSGTNKVTIKLIKRTLAGSVDAATGGDVTLTNGTKISLPANGVVQAGGGAYTGAVNVYAAYIDPTAADIMERVPGSFMANDADNKRVLLESYGMMAVELESTSGQKLQIKSGSVATLTTPIPSSIQSSAPNTIPLWYVDEATGLWKEEGTATKNGNNYVGAVSHFSFWNCDISIPAVTISMTVKSPSDQVLVHTLVKIKRTGSVASQAYGYTDSLGQVSGLVPSNENLILEVLDPCYNPVYTQNIGPFTQSTNIGTITANNSSSSLISLEGTLVNCSGSPVTNGFAIFNYGNNVWYAATNASGNFSVSLVVCPGGVSSINLLGVDETSQQQGTATNVTITTPVTNAGTISACGTSTTQFINYTLDGTNYSITNAANDSLTAFTEQGTTPPSTYLMGSGGVNFDNNITLKFSHPTPTAGTYNAQSVSVQLFQQGNVLTQPFPIVVTNFPQVVGEFYEGTFSGEFKDAQNVTHTLSGSFRIRKTW